MQKKSESKIENGVEWEQGVYWRDIVKVTYMKARIALLVQQMVKSTFRLLFIYYNEVVLWPYIVIVLHCCWNNVFLSNFYALIET